MSLVSPLLPLEIMWTEGQLDPVTFAMKMTPLVTIFLVVGISLAYLFGGKLRGLTAEAWIGLIPIAGLVIGWLFSQTFLYFSANPVIIITRDLGTGNVHSVPNFIPRVDFKPSELRNYTLVIGPHGIGKSFLARKAAEETHALFVKLKLPDANAALRSVLDENVLRQLPDMDRLELLDKAIRLRARLNLSIPYIIFDELNVYEDKTEELKRLCDFTKDWLNDQVANVTFVASPGKAQAWMRVKSCFSRNQGVLAAHDFDEEGAKTLRSFKINCEAEPDNWRCGQEVVDFCEGRALCIMRAMAPSTLDFAALKQWEQGQTFGMVFSQQLMPENVELRCRPVMRLWRAARELLKEDETKRNHELISERHIMQNLPEEDQARLYQSNLIFIDPGTQQATFERPGARLLAEREIAELNKDENKAFWDNTCDEPVNAPKEGETAAATKKSATDMSWVDAFIASNTGTLSPDEVAALRESKGGLQELGFTTLERFVKWWPTDVVPSDDKKAKINNPLNFGLINGILKKSLLNLPPGSNPPSGPTTSQAPKGSPTHSSSPSSSEANVVQQQGQGSSSHPESTPQ